MRALESLPRSWLSVELRGYRPEPDGGGTYSAYSYVDLPPVPGDLDDDLGWLLESPRSGAPSPTRPILRPCDRRRRNSSRCSLGEAPVRLPTSFSTFVSSPALHSRVRSCTSCYLDLGDVLVPVAEEDGRLVHFLSDQQWALHWLLACDSSGAESVIVTDAPLGFLVDEETLTVFDPARTGAVCAESFSEFVYRFRIEDEIWFALASDERPLTSEERAYVDHYARAGT